ncbi:MAG: ADP-ribosylglycohydrolase family protein, partial [Kiritimatiellia bacterium]
EERGIVLRAATLAEYWCLYVTPHWSEYGTGKINMRAGLLPPLCGSFQNDFRHSCGAFIRSEIWACVAPGLPEVAARYAREDGMLDHGDGEGALAEIFMAAMESAAFVVSDLRHLIEIGLSYIPPECGVAQAVHTALRCHKQDMNWREARDEILRLHRGSSFFNRPNHTSEEDRRKGFHEGVLGYDAPSNVALLVFALLDGGEDFGKVVCTAVNCGEDTDCTAASAGALWGIIHGSRAIPEQWLKPIGRGIRTIAINRGDLRAIPETVDDLTDRVLRIAEQVLFASRKAGFLSTAPTDLDDIRWESLKSTDGGRTLWGDLTAVRCEFDFFTIRVDYGGEPTIRTGETKLLRITIENTYHVQANLSLHWYLPEGWRVEPAMDGFVLSLPKHLATPVTLEFRLIPATVTRPLSRAVLELTCEGRPTVMLVPITLLNGNLLPTDTNGGV